MPFYYFTASKTRDVFHNSGPIASLKLKNTWGGALISVDLLKITLFHIFFYIYILIMGLGTIHIWRPWKLPNFQDSHPHPCSSTSKIFPSPWPQMSNFKQTLPATHPPYTFNKLWKNNHTVHVTNEIKTKT